MGKLRPILFSTDMVQAILARNKTQTRRIFKDNPRLASDLSKVDLKDWFKSYPDLLYSYSAYGRPDDILWVREKFSPPAASQLEDAFMYAADYNVPIKGFWKPSIHMPFEAARLFLRVKSIRVERLLNITESDAIAEGVKAVFSRRYNKTRYKAYHDEKHWSGIAKKVAIHFNTDFDGSGCETTYGSAVLSFYSLWNLINGKGSSRANPWVWVIEFERISKEEALK